MSDKNFTTRTASLKATSIDAYKTKTNKLTINDIPFSKVISSNVPENPTDNDMWKYVATTDDKGVVTINSDISFDYSEMTEKQKENTAKAVKVIDNKVLGENDELLMNWDTKSFTNSNNGYMNNIFNRSENLTEWKSDLSNLTNGSNMFSYTTLESFTSDLSNLTNGISMFSTTAINTFNSDLSSLTYGLRMFYLSALESFNSNLSSLINGNFMFNSTAINTFNSDLSSLKNGESMFYFCSNLTTFTSDLSNLTNGSNMFSSTAINTFNSNLSNLTNGISMFSYTALESFTSDLSSLTNGYCMFYDTALESFTSDLSSLTNGYYMFSNTQARHYNISFYEMVDGVKTKVTKTIQSEGLKEVVSDFSSLKCGYHMFGDGLAQTNSYTDDDGNEVIETTYNISPLSEESIMFIAETINDISELDITNDEHWKYTYISNGNESTSTIDSIYRGKIHLGYDSSITDTTNIMNYCDQIANKGWTVFLNGSQHTPINNEAIETANLSDNNVQTPIPHYYKPLQVTDENVAEYVDTNGNYYIIIGGQHVFGDDISTYGMFTSYEHAISEITLGLGLTKYVKPTEEEESKEEKQ